MQADESILKTDVDDFIYLLKKEGKMTISAAAKKLGLSENTIQTWTDFLIEERVLGIEYKFTTPYIYINDCPVTVSSNDSKLQTKEEFYSKALRRGLNNARIKELWGKYICANHTEFKNAFYEKAQQRGIDSDKIHKLWLKFYEDQIK